MFYSGNNFDTAEYAIGYATASSVVGPYTKNGPWIGSNTAYGAVSCHDAHLSDRLQMSVVLIYDHVDRRAVLLRRIARSLSRVA